MKKLCIGGPLDGQHVESENFIFPYTGKVTDLPECDTTRELETMHYRTADIADASGVYEVLVPVEWKGSVIAELMRFYKSDRV
jgi:hypothetical protein